MNNKIVGGKMTQREKIPEEQYLTVFQKVKENNKTLKINP